jgi:hypothetical protein
VSAVGCGVAATHDTTNNKDVNSTLWRERTQRLHFYTEDPTLTRLKLSTRPHRLKTIVLLSSLPRFSSIHPYIYIYTHTHTTVM